MAKESFITPGHAKKIARQAIAKFTGQRGFSTFMRDDPENEEILLIFYAPQSDYCVNVLISQHLHENQAKRKGVKHVAV